MRMTQSGRFGMYVDPATLSKRDQAGGIVGGMYGTPSGGDWAGRNSMFGGLRAAETPSAAPQIGELSQLREAEAIRRQRQQAQNPYEAQRLEEIEANARGQAQGQRRG
jgi:hypothetical protein